MVRYTRETWIEEAEKKYPKKFSYDNTVYIDSYHKVKVKCLKHNNEFEVSPISFIRSSCEFCPKCKMDINITQLEFLSKAKYNFPFLDFSKSKYINNNSNVIVICPEHGKFSIQAIDILNGKGLICPKCISGESFDYVKYYTNNNDKGNELSTFYKLKVTYKYSGIEFIKIGISSEMSYEKYDDDRYDDFYFEIIDEVNVTNLEAAKLKYEYNSTHNRFFLPKDIWFGGRGDLYEMDGYHQLISTQVKFVRDSLLEKQNGKCPLCERDVYIPTLDHYHGKKQHGTGLVRGVICNTCNRMTGVVENNFIRNGIDYSDAPQFLRNLADYVESKRERYIHPTERSKIPKLMKSSYNKLVKVVGQKQKIPPYTGKFTKQIDKLFEKYNLTPEFQKK
jgi:hypothetical protein